jgi:hypothetical protein
MNLRVYDRLVGPKELVTLKGQPHWVFTREFDENFCAHAMRWFKAHGAEPEPAIPRDGNNNAAGVPERAGGSDGAGV